MQTKFGDHELLLGKEFSDKRCEECFLNAFARAAKIAILGGGAAGSASALSIQRCTSKGKREGEDLS
jgi:hypothetical protein